MYKASLKTWIALALIYLVPIVIDFLDHDDRIFHNVVWFFYMIPTLILVKLKGSKYGALSTSIGVTLFLITHSLQPEGFEKHNLIVLIELLIVNGLITLIVGILFEKNNKHQLQLKETKNFLESIFHNLNIGIWSIRSEKTFGLLKRD